MATPAIHTLSQTLIDSHWGRKFKSVLTPRGSVAVKENQLQIYGVWNSIERQDVARANTAIPESDR